MTKLELQASCVRWVLLRNATVAAFFLLAGAYLSGGARAPWWSFVLLTAVWLGARWIVIARWEEIHKLPECGRCSRSCIVCTAQENGHGGKAIRVTIPPA